MEKQREIIIFGIGDFADILVEKLKDDGKHIFAYTVNQKWLRDSEYKGKPLWAFEELDHHVKIFECDIYRCYWETYVPNQEDAF